MNTTHLIIDRKHSHDYVSTVLPPLGSNIRVEVLYHLPSNYLSQRWHGLVGKHADVTDFVSAVAIGKVIEVPVIEENAEYEEDAERIDDDDDTEQPMYPLPATLQVGDLVAVLSTTLSTVVDAPVSTVIKIPTGVVPPPSMFFKHFCDLVIKAVLTTLNDVSGSPILVIGKSAVATYIAENLAQSSGVPCDQMPSVYPSIVIPEGATYSYILDCRIRASIDDVQQYIAHEGTYCPVSFGYCAEPRLAVVEPTPDVWMLSGINLLDDAQGIADKLQRSVTEDPQFPVPCCNFSDVVATVTTNQVCALQVQ